MELILYTLLDGLAPRLEAYPDLAVMAPSRLEQAQRLLTSDRPPNALYLDDTRGTPTPQLWALIQAAHAAQTRILVNMIGMGQSLLHDARLLGLDATSERDPAAVAAWIGQCLSVAPRTPGGQLPIVAVAAAKGGVGKTFVTCLLAEGLRRRGLNVLVWDSDISNPGMIPAFRIPASAPSYLHLIKHGPAHWNSAGIAPFLYQPEHTRGTSAGWGAIDFLIGSHAVAKAENDVHLHDWQGLYHGVLQLDGYDLVLLDTPPDYLRRPYATHALLLGGRVVLPCPPGARERMGVGHLLDHLREMAPDRLEHCGLLFIEPEKGVTVTVNAILPMFARRYPEVRVLGTVPRTPRLASLADEHDGYRSILDLGPESVFAQAAHRIVDSLATQLALSPRLPMPQIGALAALRGRIRGERVDVPAANTSVATIAREHLV